ncbi:MAG: hypothetical protein GY717_12410 [Rhodobacteraceae bacterium]|nr:hypothetical protein [Paracoccaceae bacterium]
MPSLTARYAAGEHEEVWRLLDRRWLSVGEGYTLFDIPDPSETKVEDIMRQTFERVARNVDRLTGRLRDYGYRFESEAGRLRDPRPPRTPCGKELETAIAETEERFGDLPAFDHLPGPFPPALIFFGQIVGNVDLSQRYPYEFSANETETIVREQLEKLSPEELQKFTFSDPEASQLVNDFLPVLQKALRDLEEARSPEELAAARKSEAARLIDGLPHLHDDDPVLSRLGNWDPLEVEFTYLAYMIGEEESELSPVETGGLALAAEFAASFEHKANISGAYNPAIHLPAARYDPIVHAEGIRLPFTTYLRRSFARGGFFGTPRTYFRATGFDLNSGSHLPRESWPPIKEVEPGIWIPEHPVLADLVRNLEPF